MPECRYPASNFSFNIDDIDPHALDIVVKLQEAGFEAYIVGGGVRDLLLDFHPKDFDIATSAKPEQVRHLFKNCRLIGRRFRLAHVYFRYHIIEVATFRGNHSDAESTDTAHTTDDGMIIRDNVFGTMEEDAHRRDLSINALFFDPSNNEIIDYTGGMDDIQSKTIRLIGDANVRFQEDPVRILRAIRFAAKLGFSPDKECVKAIKAHHHRLAQGSPGRLFDEYTKLFLHGHSEAVFKLLLEYDLFGYLFPQANDMIKQDDHCKSLIERSLVNTDARIESGKSINPAFLLAVFLWTSQKAKQIELQNEGLPPFDAFNKACQAVLSTQAQLMAIPKRFSHTIRDIWSMQKALERRRPKQITNLLYHKKFRAAYDFLLIRAEFKEVPTSLTHWWTSIQGLDTNAQKEMVNELAQQPKASATTQQWQQLDKLAKKIRQSTLEELFANHPTRVPDLTLEACGISLDYSKNRIDQACLNALSKLANDTKLSSHIEAMFTGEKINSTEGRAVLHTACRNMTGNEVLVDGIDIMPAIHAQLNKMTEFVDQIHSGAWTGATGEKITDIVNLGIGGSDLGPHMVTQALQPYHIKGLNCHFVSNVDGADLALTLSKCRPESTLFIIASKSFTTQETLLNASSARTWLTDALGDVTPKHFVAITSKVDLATEFGINAENCFEMWDFVGGRYSLWSTIGLPIALAVGMSNFRQLLSGAHEMDLHFRSAPLAQNMPVIMAMIGVWYRNILKFSTHAVLPYDQSLSLLPSYLQQLDMESNGKSVDIDGHTLKHQSGPVIWGGAGTNGQHAFHQLLHQGTSVIPADFILFKKPHHNLPEHHEVLMAHCLAQTQALMQGKSREQAFDELIAAGLDEERAKQLAPHKVIPGNKPSNLLLIEQLTPQSLGSLIALYEHKVFVQSIIWDINAFDQWGVELGKQLSGPLLSAITAPNSDLTFDASTMFNLSKLKT